MTKLAEMTVSQAASKGLEVLIYGKYVDAQQEKPEYSWHTAFTGTFEEYLANYIGSEIADGDDEVYDSEKEDYVPVSELTNLDNQHIWQNLKSEGNEGSRDNWSAKVEAEYGGQGDGDQYWMVIAVSDSETTRYFRKDGWYASYDGGYLDGETYEVTPQERTVVFYE